MNMPYMFFYTCNNSTYGYDFQEFAENLGAKKCYGKYRGKGPGSYFYLVPSEEVYNKIKAVAKKRFNVEVQKLLEYREEDYTIAEDLDNSLVEEFKLYESLWEDLSKDLNEDLEDFGELTSDFTWIMPDGEKVDVSSPEARHAEVERHRELVFDKVSAILRRNNTFVKHVESKNQSFDEAIEAYFKYNYTDKVTWLLNQINDCVQDIAKVEAECFEDNKRILGKLQRYTSLVHNPYLNRIVGLMNKKEVDTKTFETRGELSSLNSELRRCYFKSDK